ncbi:hypothetical protein J31TS6_07900 [Brevibacillus reuszeri]|uniref:DUF1653 domain-containing protein n=1 Tax=Brevibacillus reuszeri TaxID=54915 RepID=UPI001B2CEEEC|nr:DUF1653 domain-containing protein [Brevibacillus reuszeri]GIO04762.1 hypothetical protein J31TS6_07900 [Brevibacillus reuszeri]
MQGLYQHYKGTAYDVYSIAKHTETEADLVVYQATKTGLWFARPLEMFTGTVEHRGEIVPRFQKLPEPEPIHIDEQEEAEFIQEFLLKNGSGIISVEDIKLITQAQFEFMRHKGLVVDEE